MEPLIKNITVTDEIKVGITYFMNKAKGVSGIYKFLYSDFVV